MANVIADVAGHYKTLMALIDKMPDDELIFLGDLVDRGPRSKEVVEFVMEGGHRCVFANHEHLMLDHCDPPGDTGRFYQYGTWLWNGGQQTIFSYGALELIPKEVLTWMRSLPKYLEVDGVFLAHSFIHPDYTLEEALDLGKNAGDPDCDRSIIWSRAEPIRRDEYDLQVAGHNSQFGLRSFTDDQGEFAVCLDDCRNKVLTGMHLPTRKIYQQEYID